MVEATNSCVQWGSSTVDQRLLIFCPYTITLLYERFHLSHRLHAVPGLRNDLHRGQGMPLNTLGPEELHADDLRARGQAKGCLSGMKCHR